MLYLKLLIIILVFLALFGIVFYIIYIIAKKSKTKTTPRMIAFCFCYSIAYELASITSFNQFIAALTIGSALWTTCLILLDEIDISSKDSLEIKQDRNYLVDILKMAENCLDIKKVIKEENKYLHLEPSSDTYNILLDVSISFGEVTYKREKGVRKLYLIKDVYKKYENKEFIVPHGVEICEII